MSKRSSFDIIGLEDNLDHHDHQQSYVISIRDAEGPQMLRVKFDPLGPLKHCIVNTTIIITRPWPAYGRHGLARSSGGDQSGRINSSHSIIEELARSD